MPRTNQNPPAATTPPAAAVTEAPPPAGTLNAEGTAIVTADKPVDQVEAINRGTGEVIKAGAGGALVHTEAGFAMALHTNAMMDGEDDGSSALGRMAMYQGTTTEQALYPTSNFKAGNFIDTLDKRLLGDTTIEVVPVYGFVTWVHWVEGEKAPRYVEHERSKVPADHLEWKDGKRPIATKIYNVMMLVKSASGYEPWPYLFMFKRTGFKAGQMIFKLEDRRRFAKLKRGLYRLGSENDKNAAGQAFKRLTYQPAGDCPAEFNELLEVCVSDILRTRNRLYDAVIASVEDAVNAGASIVDDADDRETPERV